MVYNDALVKPLIKRKPGECFVCGHPLGVLQRDMVDILLNADGLPVHTEEISFQTIGYCAHCGEKYPNIRRRGIYFDTRGPLYDFINGTDNNEGENNNGNIK